MRELKLKTTQTPSSSNSDTNPHKRFCLTHAHVLSAVEPKTRNTRTINSQLLDYLPLLHSSDEIETDLD